MSMYRQLWLAIIASMLLALGGGLLASLDRRLRTDAIQGGAEALELISV